MHYRDFCAEGFDPADYANMIIQAPAGHQFNRGDISASLSRLTFSIEHLNKQLHDQVTTHYEDLLEQVTGLTHLEDALVRVKEGVQSLNGSFDRVKLKVRETHDQIRSQTTQLERVQDAAELLRRVRRFLYLVRRLEGQVPTAVTALGTVTSSGGAGSMDDGQRLELPKAAMSINELDSILQETDMGGIDVVEVELPKIGSARSLIVSQAEAQIQAGLTAQNQADVALGLQVFYNLGQLAGKTQQIVDHMLDVITKEVQVALSPATLNKEVHDGNAATRKVEGPISNAPIYASALWKRIERLMDVMYENSVKFAASTFLHQIFHVGYPKLLRLFHDFFSRLNVFAGLHSRDAPVLPTTSLPRPGDGVPLAALSSADDLASSSATTATAADTSLLLRTLSPFKTAYLRESLSRLFEPINNAFPDKPAVGARPLPTRDDVDKVLRTLSRELEVAKFDPVLLKAVTENVGKALSLYAIRTEHMAATDSTAYQVSGTGTATSSQILNIEIVNCLWNLAEGVAVVAREFEDAVVESAMKDAIEALHKVVLSIIEPLMTHLSRELENTILKIHKEDYKVCAVGARVLDFFLRQASLARPLSEPGKLRMTSDMTQLEFAVSQWISPQGLKLESALGDSYRALRAFRQLLFLDLSQLAAAHHTAHLSPIVVAHHLMVRSYPTIPLPTALFGWTEAQYSVWLDSHSLGAGCGLLMQCVESYAEEVKRKGEREFRVEYPVLKAVLEAGGVVKGGGGTTVKK
ncbi:Conserved oligomeric Golgi complex subunit [Irineochytrium annulatum]|nr:Conserved oligomeric Golgi complex subunit [Irineochytrium annulatum]